MAAPYYIGDETSAAAFRLAGARVIVPRAGEDAAALAAARGNASLVLVSAATAARIPAREIDAAQAALAPLTLVVPDLREEVAVPDLALRLRGQLGLDAAS
jgi:vacuolar-type H+-ATPase subunit F/Vma7